MRKYCILLMLVAASVIKPFAISAAVSDRMGLRTGWLFASPETVTGGYTSFCQDESGYLWIGTDTGLLRFDGANCDIYTAESNTEGAISDNRVLGLLYDSRGRLWVGTANGLNLYDPESDSFRIIPLPSKNFYGYVIALAEQVDGTVTFIVSGVGMYAITEKDGEPEAFNYMPYNDAAKDYNTLVCTDSGRLYVGTQNGSVFAISRSGQSTEIKVASDYITGLTVEATGNLLVSDINNVYRIYVADNSITKLSQPANFRVNCLSVKDKWGGVYVGTPGEGLWVVEPGSDEVVPCTDIYSSFMDLSHSNIGAVYCSPDGNLWLGCNYYGIVMVPVNMLPFMYRKLSDVFPDFGGGIKALTTWNGNVLVAFDPGRLALFSPDGKLLMSSSVRTGGVISSVTMTPDDKAIIGMSNDGLWEMSLPDGRLRKLLDVPGKYPLITAVPAGENELMVAVFGKGVMLYNTVTHSERWLECDNVKGPLFNPFVTNLCRTDDKIWMALYGGIACYDLNSDEFIEIDQAPFLPGASFDIAPVDENSVVVATSHGLIHLDLANGVLRKYTAEDGLLDSDVRTIAIDNNGGLWIGSLRGLSYQSPDDGHFTSFRGGYGLVEMSFNKLAFSDKSDLVYLASSKGITSFNPGSLLSTDFDRGIRVSGIYLNGKKVTSATRFANRKIIEGELGNPTSLYLPYQENALTLRLATRDFRDGSNVQYMWHIEGADDDWNTTQRGENMIYLPHLDPGKYKLQIKGVENNVLSEPLELTIRISSPWYLSDVAKLFYALVMVALFMLVWTVRKKKREELENDARIRYFMDISHDIRSPVTLIVSPLESLLKQPFDDDVKMKLKLMYRNCQRILGLVNQLLEIRKLEKGKMRLSCRRTNVGVFISELVEMFRPQATDKGLNMSFIEEDDVPEIWVDRDNFDKILVNLISNAIKYTPSGGDITVKVGKLTDSVIGPAVEVSVTDTGIGLDSKMEARIFERFYRGHDKTYDKDGFGIGLDLCRRLVEFHHGVIMGKNREDGVKGSVFSVRLPVDGSCYSKDELITGRDRTPRDVNRVSNRIVPALESGVMAKSGQKSSMMKYVLVVEDDADLRDYICGQLSMKYRVKGVENGADAMKAISESMPDLIVSDVKMPGVDGLTLLHRLKSNADTHHIPVVLLSSQNAVADRMAGWERGADAYLGKPFVVDELERLIANLIDNRLRMKGKFSGVQDTEDVIASPEYKGNDEALMERMMKIIDRNIDDRTLNVEKLSQEVGVSRAHLHRKMKDMIGMTPSDFIRSIRLRRACELLQKGDIEVTQVAYALGFTSQPHFSSVFKKFVGVSPSEYRAKWESGKAPVVPPQLLGKTDADDNE